MDAVNLQDGGGTEAALDVPAAPSILSGTFVIILVVIISNFLQGNYILRKSCDASRPKPSALTVTLVGMSAELVASIFLPFHALYPLQASSAILWLLVADRKKRRRVTRIDLLTISLIVFSWFFYLAVPSPVHDLRIRSIAGRVVTLQTFLYVGVLLAIFAVLERSPHLVGGGWSSGVLCGLTSVVVRTVGLVCWSLRDRPSVASAGMLLMCLLLGLSVHVAQRHSLTRVLSWVDGVGSQARGKSPKDSGDVSTCSTMPVLDFSAVVAYGLCSGLFSTISGSVVYGELSSMTNAEVGNFTIVAVLHYAGCFLALRPSIPYDLRDSLPTSSTDAGGGRRRNRRKTKADESPLVRTEFNSGTADASSDFHPDHPVPASRSAARADPRAPASHFSREQGKPFYDPFQNVDRAKPFDDLLAPVAPFPSSSSVSHDDPFQDLTSSLSSDPFAHVDAPAVNDSEPAPPVVETVVPASHSYDDIFYEPNGPNGVPTTEGGEGPDDPFEFDDDGFLIDGDLAPEQLLATVASPPSLSVGEEDEDELFENIHDI